MTDYAKINKFLTDHGYVGGLWEYHSPGEAVVIIMDIVIDIINKVETDARRKANNQVD